MTIILNSNKLQSDASDFTERASFSFDSGSQVPTLLGSVPGPYSMLTNRYVVKTIRYGKPVSISAIRYALKRVTIRKVDLFYAAFAVQ